MDCIKITQNLHHYLDGELGRWRRQLVQRHLETCMACSSGFEFEARFRQVLLAKCREEVPPGLQERIIAALGAMGALGASDPSVAAPPPESAPLPERPSFPEPPRLADPRDGGDLPEPRGEEA